MAQCTGHLTGQLRRIPLGDGDDQLGIGISVEQAGIGSEGDDIDVDTRGADDHHWLTVSSISDSDTGHRILEIRSRCSRCSPTQILGIHESGLLYQS